MTDEDLIHVLIAFVAGIAAAIFAVRHYRSRDGRVAKLVKMIIGEPKG